MRVKRMNEIKSNVWMTKIGKKERKNKVKMSDE